MSVSSILLRGMTWTAFAAMANKTMGIMTQFALGWFLLKSDFSVYAFASAIFAILSPLTDQGLQRVLTAQREVNKKTIIFVQKFAISFAILSTILLVFASALIFFNSERNEEALTLLTLSTVPLLSIKSGLDKSLLQRAHRFYDVSIVSTVSSLIRNSITIASAFLGAGFFAFVAGILVAKLYEIFHLNFILSKFKEELNHEIERASEATIKPSALGWIIIASILTALVTNGDYMLLGLLGENDLLADYYFGYQAVATLTTLLGVTMAGVFLPVLGTLDKKSKSKLLKNSLQSLILLTAPILGLAAFLVDDIFEILWGSKWREASIVSCAMLIALSTRIAGPLARSYIESVGRWRTQATLMAIDAAGLIITIYAAWKLNDNLSIPTLAWSVATYRLAYGVFILIVVSSIAFKKPLENSISLAILYVPFVFAIASAASFEAINTAGWISGIIFTLVYFSLSIAISPIRSKYYNVIKKIRIHA